MGLNELVFIRMCDFKNLSKNYLESNKIGSKGVVNKNLTFRIWHWIYSQKRLIVKEMVIYHNASLRILVYSNWFSINSLFLMFWLTGLLLEENKTHDWLGANWSSLK